MQLSCRRPPTMYHTHKTLPILQWYFQGVVSELSEPKRGAKYIPPPQLRLWHDFVGVVRGLWHSILMVRKQSGTLKWGGPKRGVRFFFVTSKWRANDTMSLIQTANWFEGRHVCHLCGARLRTLFPHKCRTPPVEKCPKQVELFSFVAVPMLSETLFWATPSLSASLEANYNRVLSLTTAQKLISKSLDAGCLGAFPWSDFEAPMQNFGASLVPRKCGPKCGLRTISCISAFCNLQFYAFPVSCSYLH